MNFRVREAVEHLFDIGFVRTGKADLCAGAFDRIEQDRCLFLRKEPDLVDDLHSHRRAFGRLQDLG